MTITVCHLYPDLLNQNGDRGNIMALVQRCRWRGLPVQVQEIKKGHPLNLAHCDLLFIGGGTLQGKTLALQELTTWVDVIRTAVEKDLVLLAVGEGFELLGQYCRLSSGAQSPGLKILKTHTEFKGARILGPVAVEVNLDDEKTILVGFENHSGKTFLNGAAPLGWVKQGGGNNSQDGTEGVRYKNVFGSYLQGPLLPLNPVFTDYLIQLVLQQKNKDTFLAPLDDTLEQQVHQAYKQQLLKM